MHEYKLGNKILLLSAVAYICGFVAWNYFLSQFGFFEYNLFQTRFLSAGLLFLFPPLIIWWLLELPTNFASFLVSERAVRIFQKFVVLVLLVIYFIFFLRNIFPHTPQYLGGAKPFPISVIFGPEKVNFYKDFEIGFYPSGKGEPLKLSHPLCNLYQNNDLVIVGVVKPLEVSDIGAKISERIVILRRDEATGFALVPVQDAERAYVTTCQPFIELGWY